MYNNSGNSYTAIEKHFSNWTTQKVCLMEGKRPTHDTKNKKIQAQARIARLRLSQWSSSRHAHTHMELLVGAGTLPYLA
jgi:hypothetical protein